MGVLIKYQEVEIVADGSEDHLNFLNCAGLIVSGRKNVLVHLGILKVLLCFRCLLFSSVPLLESRLSTSLPGASFSREGLGAQSSLVGAVDDEQDGISSHGISSHSSHVCAAW